MEMNEAIANFIGQSLGQVFGPHLETLLVAANDPRARVHAIIVMETPTDDGGHVKGAFTITPLGNSEAEVLATIERTPAPTPDDGDDGLSLACDCDDCRRSAA